MIRNAALELEMARNPRDCGPVLVYADWLQLASDSAGRNFGRWLAGIHAPDPKRPQWRHRCTAALLHDILSDEWCRILGDHQLRIEARHG